MIKRYLVIGIILLSILMSVNPSFAFDNVMKSSMRISSGNTLYVGGSGPDNYTKIQDAIDNASNGDTVFVYNNSSPYIENLDIYKSINLIGENTHDTILQSKTVNINIYSDNVNIQSLTIESISPLRQRFGIRLNSSSCTITCCKFLYQMYAIDIFFSSNHNTFYRNIFQSCYRGINFRYPLSCSNTIKHNNFISTKPVQDIAFRNNWISNYYDNWIGIGPKIIWGFWYFLWFNIDWRPAKEPYDISRITI